jgi:C_GCAxxG_C_C family probable redox protein
LEKDNEDNIEKIAADYFNSGFNCSESVLLSIAKVKKIKNKYIPKVASGFGGGLGRHGETCGVITGAVMAIGLKYGRSETEGKDREAKENIYKIVDGFIKSFEKEFKNTRCIDLIGCNMLTPEGLQKIKDENIHVNICTKLVEFAAREAIKLI